MTRLSNIAATALFAIVSMSGAKAQDVQRVLSLTPYVCEAQKAYFIDWAGSTQGHASFAVPRIPARSDYSCDNPATGVPARYSFEYDSVRGADARALEDCNAVVPEGFRSCVIVARAYTRPAK